MGGAPKPPKVQPPAKMPDAEDPEMIEARRRRLEQMRATGGRQSTLLGDYVSNQLGSSDGTKVG